MYEVIVIGGGIVGTAAAYHLARAGAATLLIDRQDAGRATDAAAGILSAETYGSEAQSWYDLALRAAEDYPRLVAELEEHAAAGYEPCPKLTVAVDDSEIAAFEEARGRIQSRQQRGLPPGPAQLHEIGSDEARRRFPFLAPIRRALFFADSARVDGRQLTAALSRAAQAKGLKVKTGSVAGLLLRGNRVAGVVVDAESIEARSTLIAAGCWSPAFQQQLGLRVPVEPQRGQLVHLRVIDGDTLHWPIIENFRGYYLVPFAQGRVVAGATRERGASFEAQITAAGLHEVLREAFRLVPSLAGAEIIETRAGLRPLAADGTPILGPVPGRPGVFLATGHGSAGLQLGPYTGKLVAEVILGQRPASDIAAFSVSRFVR